MIESHYRQEDQARVLVVQANQSLNWRGNVIVACLLGSVSFLLGLVLAVQGFWLVLPFAGLEMLALLHTFYLVSRRLSRREVITIGREDIRVDWGRIGPESSVAVKLYWARLHYSLPDSPFETGDLSLACQGRSIPLGRALGRAEKQRLYRLLSALIRRAKR